MTELSAFLPAHASVSLAVGGFVIGLAFGYVTHRGNFCTMGSVASWITLQDARGMRSWVLAVAIAILAVTAMTQTGILDLKDNMYTQPRINWVSNVIGGLGFGIGMVLAGGCASRNLVRAGAGDLRSGLTLLVLSLFASMTLGGVFGPVRAWLEQMTSATLPFPSQRLTDIADALTGSGDPAHIAIPVIIAAGLIIKCFADEPFRRSRRHLLIGVCIGLLIAAAWALTGLAYDEMADRVQKPASLTFIKPSADTFDWLERSTALGLPGFGIASVFGTFAGGALSAFLHSRFRLIAFADLADTMRHMAGAALMGIGGVMALGCSIGQGITGVSTLAIGSILAAGAIVTGTVLGVKVLQFNEDV